MNSPSFPLLDDLIGGGQQRFRDGEAEGLGGLEVDDEFELGRELNWQIARLCSTQDAIHVGVRISKKIDGLRSIGHQAAIDTVIVAGARPAQRAVLQQTRTIPIVMVTGADPVPAGVVDTPPP